MYLTIIIFVFGLCIGSFLNAFQYRAEIDKKITGRSLCPKCKHQLAWYDLVPLFSWVFLRGKCRYCKEPISIQYPFIELLTGVSFVLFGLKAGYIKELNNILLNNLVLSQRGFSILLASFVATLIMISCLILIALHDYKTKYVLSAAVYLAIGCGLILLLINYQNAWSFWPIFEYIYPFLAPALIASSIFGLIYILSHGTWMGAGDIEIVFLMGLFLGWPNTAIAFYVAFISGAIIGVILLIIQRAKLKTEVAFGPFLIFGTFVAFLCSTQIISFYDRIFLGF